jgi:hypothetical protein
MSCIIESLLERPFSSRSFEEKKELISTGRPIPNLPNLVQNCGKFTRHFQSNIYQKCEWLAGSETLNAVFCWNCLLFGKDRHTSWTKGGFKHLGNLSKSISSHEITVNHIRSSLCAASFGQSRIETALDDQLRQEISQHNKMVKRNRDILRRLINAVCFLGKQELAFRGHDESKNSNNRGNYIELLKYTADYDPLLAEHLETATVFKGFSSHIQNDLIDAVGSSLLCSIKEELKEANFVAVLVDETTDISNKAQFSIVFRYISDGQVKERFLGFSDISSDKHAPAISLLILEYLNNFECSKKIVAQTYDGASTMSGHLSGVQARIKEIHPEALFVHCYAHALNLVLSQSVSVIPQCKIFFSTLNGIAAFFSRSPKRVTFLDEFLKRRLPNVCPTRWNYSSRLVNTVYKFRKELCEVFQAMLEHPEEIESDILAPVNGFLSVLEEFQFVFFLSVFNKIFCHTDVLFDVLQHQTSDIVYCRKKIENTRQTIVKQRDDFEKTYEEVLNDVGPPNKRRQFNYSRVYCEIFDNIDGHFEHRFEDYSKLDFLQLLATDKFQKHEEDFPEAALKSLLNIYGKFFDHVRLKNELLVFYSSEEFRGKTLSELCKLFVSRSNNLYRNAFSQIGLLVSLLYTIPVTTASVERSFSTLKRIKTYSRNTTGQKRLSHLGIISIESELLAELKNKESFFDEVVKIFAAKERRMDFNFR